MSVWVLLSECKVVTRRLSQTIDSYQAGSDLPGATWLDVINPKSVAAALISVTVPELIAVEAEALAASVLSSEP